MTWPQRAAQLWPLLAWVATNRQTVTYEIVSRLTGLPPYSLGSALEHIQSYCILNDLPPLTAIVVKATSGQPGDGNLEAANALMAFVRVHSHDWLSVVSPTPEQLQAAVTLRPSNANNVSQ